MGLINEVLQKFGIDRSVASEISSSVKRFKPVLKYGVKVNSLDLTADELEAILTGGDSSSVVTDITAGTTQTQNGATALTGRFNNVTTVANANDGVKLPAATAGLTVVVHNSGANALKIWPASGDAIDSGSANAGVTVGINTRVTFTAIDGTTWKSNRHYSQQQIALVGNSGQAGQVRVYPATASKGSLAISCADNSGDTEIGIATAAQAGARTISIPDWSTKASSDSEVSLAGIKVVADTTNRPGALGCLLFSTGDSKLYVCTTASATAATWTVVGSQS